MSSPPFLIMLVNEDLQNLLRMFNRGKSLDTIHLVQRGGKKKTLIRFLWSLGAYGGQMSTAGASLTEK